MRRSGSATRESAFNMTLMSGDDTGIAAVADCSSLKREVLSVKCEFGSLKMGFQEMDFGDFQFAIMNLQ
jgi:hypothetical protein